MTTQELSQALIRLSEFKVGLAEAAMLATLAVVREASNDSIQVLLDIDANSTWSRTGALRRKKLLTTHHRKNGKAFHRITHRGDEVIRRALKS